MAKEKIAKVKKEMRQFSEVKTTTNEYVQYFKKYETINEVNRDLLLDLVDKVLVENLDKSNVKNGKQVKKVRVDFNFADEAKALQLFLDENALVGF